MTSLQRPPVYKDHFFTWKWVAFVDRSHSIFSRKPHHSIALCCCHENLHLNPPFKDDPVMCESILMGDITQSIQIVAILPPPLPPLPILGHSYSGLGMSQAWATFMFYLFLSRASSNSILYMKHWYIMVHYIANSKHKNTDVYCVFWTKWKADCSEEIAGLMAISSIPSSW